MKRFIRGLLGTRAYGLLVQAYYSARKLRYRIWLWLNNARSVPVFLLRPGLAASLPQRLTLLRQFRTITAELPCPHRSFEILSFVTQILRVGAQADGVFVEAGCFKGGSTAKFSLAARLVDRKLVVFDSFQGLPENDENQGLTTYGARITAFYRGSYKGALAEVQANVARFGDIEICEFIPGWFDDTMPGFQQPVLGAYIDVDLATSTQTCLKNLYPHLMPNGRIISQDGHLPLVLEALDDDQFWESELGIPKPRIKGFGKSTILEIAKEV